MATKYRIHLILIEVKDEGTEDESADILREDEIEVYKEDFETLEEANRAFDQAVLSRSGHV